MATIKFGNEIEAVTSIDADSYRVRLKYADGFEGEVDLSGIFRNPKGLADEIRRGSLFGRCFVEAGALAWPNGFELCPDALRAKAREVGRKSRKTA